MATDDLDAPLGQDITKRRRLRIPVTVTQVIAGMLGLIVATFGGWALVASDPLGGEPIFVASAAPTKTEMPVVASGTRIPNKYDGPGVTAAPAQPPTNIVTIIDGSTGKRQDVPIAAPQEGRGRPEQGLLEGTRHGAIPKIAPDGKRPAEAYARIAKPQGKPDAPRIAIVITGLGVSGNVTQSAMSKLPGPVTFAFGPTALKSIARLRKRGPTATKCCCRFRWSRSTIRTTIPARRRCWCHSAPSRISTACTG